MTATTHPDVLDRSVEKANNWINEVAAELETADIHEPYRVLHALRDRLPVPEAAQLSSQLPMLIRGIYFEGWQPGHCDRS